MGKSEHLSCIRLRYGYSALVLNGHDNLMM